MHIQWDDVQVFLAVAETGSVSGAARALGLTQPTVSRRLAEIESRLGEPLFRRAAAGAKILPTGERLLAPARRMAEWATELERTLDRVETRPAGVVRITALPALAFDFLAPFAAWLKGELPEITLEVIATIQYLDLVRRDADLALRTDRASSKELHVVAELKTTVAAFGSRAYAARVPPAAKLGDLDWIGWAPPLEHLSPNRELAAMVPGFKPVFASDDFLVQLAAARAGLGAIVMGRAQHRFAPDPELVELDVDLGPVTASLYLVSTRSALAIPRVRAVADRIAAELARVDTRPAHAREQDKAREQNKRRTGRSPRSTRS